LVALWRRRTVVGLTALGAFLAALYAVTIGHGFVGPYFVMAITGAFFCVVAGAIALDDASKRAGIEMRRWVGSTVALLTALVLWPRFSEDWDKYPTHKFSEVPVAADELEFVLAHSEPSDTIWTL